MKIIKKLLKGIGCLILSCTILALTLVVSDWVGNARCYEVYYYRVYYGRIERRCWNEHIGRWVDEEWTVISK